MKLSNRKTGSGKVELNMTSMIDVIFLLLIFFMVTASFHLTERNLESAIQTKNQAASETRAHLEPVIVEIVPDGSGGHMFKVGSRNFTDTQEMTKALSVLGDKTDGAFVRVNDDTPFAMAAAAIQSCHDAGFPTVSYIPPSSGQ